MAIRFRSSILTATSSSTAESLDSSAVRSSPKRSMSDSVSPRMVSNVSCSVSAASINWSIASSSSEMRFFCAWISAWRASYSLLVFTL